jgi:hypothetical protein
MSKKNTIILIITLSFSIFLNSCGIYKYTDQRNQPTTGLEKARKNIEEGRGVSVGSLLKNRGTNFEFSTSNPMWRASLEILDFLPLATVDYGGGIIITDWYSDSINSKDSLKITIRFLSNEIRADSFKIIVHKKNCNNLNDCQVNQFSSKINQELSKKILQKASEIEIQNNKDKK